MFETVIVIANSSDVEELIVVLERHPETPIVCLFKVGDLSPGKVVPLVRVIAPVSRPFLLAPGIPH